VRIGWQVAEGTRVALARLDTAKDALQHVAGAESL
jgi:hypothetical protein